MIEDLQFTEKLIKYDKYCPCFLSPLDSKYEQGKKTQKYLQKQLISSRNML